MATRKSSLSVEDRRAILRREIEAELEDRDLSGWEWRLLQCLARNPSWQMDKQLDAASALASRDVPEDELVALKKLPRWRERWRSERASLREDVAAARETFEATYEPAAQLLASTISTLQTEVQSGSDKMGAVRAVAPLVTPLLDRVIPKREELDVRTQGQVVHISLTPEQAVGFNAPLMPVEAIEMVQANDGGWVPRPPAIAGPES